MKRAVVLFALLALTMAGTANAIPYDYVDVVDEGPLGPNAAYISWTDPDPLTGTFSIVAPGSDDATEDIGLFDIGGFDRLTEEATSGVVKFWLSDDAVFMPDSVEKLQVVLDGGITVGLTYDFTLIPLTLDSGDVNFLGSVNADGMLNYSLTMTAGDAFVHYSTLEVNAEAKNNPIPETSSLALWGTIASVFGVGYWFRRKRRIPS